MKLMTKELKRQLDAMKINGIEPPSYFQKDNLNENDKNDVILGL